MTTPSPSPAELTHQHRLLCTAAGPKGSGAKRYGAAMFFYNMGQIGDDMLEIYRRCSKFDREDPIDLARFEGVELPAFERASAAGSSA